MDLDEEDGGILHDTVAVRRLEDYPANKGRDISDGTKQSEYDLDNCSQDGEIVEDNDKIDQDLDSETSNPDTDAEDDEIQICSNSKIFGQGH
ncbi:hypothetical protein SARC_03806 [Sphaeroforma arctica JP610]|uniref:Uncharacterized protein n=1 Tax=Sphaeroforma arctica JP610 TaxID=667725 RepID=A0A0L0G583_9EUKA|nr:hypothetical protein SARC_03806 [Sphaeroforma arctica JP610]KNC83986.1 hypothetical protein SARC_03806 [Sphaeroforma arctica JP610]|eukprot:XP_014157888.1 hypothetical protein SARC_03806 [Sphaeroforma arctica JP610]